MPARIRLLTKIATIILVLVFGAVVLRLANRGDDVTYKLTSGIATNVDNKGSQLVEVDLLTISGETISTSALIGMPTIINIWYSTCEPCRRELPVLAQGALEYNDKVRFVGVNIKDSARVASEFASKYGVDFEIYLDNSGAFISKSGIGTAPVTLAVNAQGVIINQIAGELSVAKLDELVAELLK